MQNFLRDTAEFMPILLQGVWLTVVVTIGSLLLSTVLGLLWAMMRVSGIRVLSGLSAGFSAVGAIGDTMQLGTELDASLIEVRMRVNFAQLADENKGFLGRMAASAKASAKMFPSVDNLMVAVQTGPQRSTLIGKHMLTLSSDAFAEVREKAATGADVAGAVAVGLLKLALGSKVSSSTKELEVVAEPTTYKTVVGQGLAAAGNMVVARMKAER